MVGSENRTRPVERPSVVPSCERSSHDLPRWDFFSVELARPSLGETNQSQSPLVLRPLQVGLSVKMEFICWVDHIITIHDQQQCMMMID